MREEPIWIKRMAVAFDEWAKRAGDTPIQFFEDAPADYGYQCAKYFDALIRELDKDGKLPKAKSWKPYERGQGDQVSA